MSSKYLSSLSKEDYENLSNKLLRIQNSRCYICQKPIDPKIHPTNIDHIIPLVLSGKDSEENFAITHESCNKSKLDANLKTARILAKLRAIQEKTLKTEGKPATLKHILTELDGSKYDFRYRIEEKSLIYTLSDIGNNSVFTSPIYHDELSDEDTAFVEIPIEYL